ncbi:methylated-DNA--[protein]-cysteine S-methyltransferase [Halalkalibaculum sp. DA3122]|uniref:methylated-DNA--[protein]-cysteine S-methyltransferase n=1 Tax=Halalkalibaculum sp. DA3122 TaxID=3373607 RepID=UPI00375419F0
MIRDEFHSPIGTLHLFAEEECLTKLEFAAETSGRHSSLPVLELARGQLQEYFNGERSRFDLPIKPAGTGFQQRVWEALSDIPMGKTVTYRQLSDALGNPNSVRAVGRANGQNPIPIIIPCHRVIGAGGTLVGYSGGIERKKWLLQHEGVLLI